MASWDRLLLSSAPFKQGLYKWNRSQAPWGAGLLLKKWGRMLSKVVEASKGGSEHAQITTTVYRTDKEESKFVLTMVKNPHHVLSIQVTIEKNIVQECLSDFVSHLLKTHLSIHSQLFSSTKSTWGTAMAITTVDSEIQYKSNPNYHDMW